MTVLGELIKEEPKICSIPGHFMRFFMNCMPEIWDWDNIILFLNCCVDHFSELMEYKERGSVEMWGRLVQLVNERTCQPWYYSVSDCVELSEVLVEFVECYKSEWQRIFDFRKLLPKVEAVRQLVS